MPRRVVYVILIFDVFSSIFAKSDEFAIPFESIGKRVVEDNESFSAIAREKNSSRIAILPRSNHSVINYSSSFDKHPRTVNHRLASDSKDKSRYDSNLPRLPDSYYDRIPVDSNRYSTKFGERLPVDRYGWQTLGQPPDGHGSAGRPATDNHGGSPYYEKNHTGDRFTPWYNYGSESSRKPGNYDTDVFGGYGYGAGGHGGYGFTRPPIGHGGGSVGYGISGTVANGDEIGPLEPNHSEGNVPSHSNIQAQKAVALKALAGVALLGAAAALATNPVLLPLGVLSGRKKRSNLSTDDKDVYLDYISTIVKNDAAKYHDDDTKPKVSLSTACIAKLICETRRNYGVQVRSKSGTSRRKLAFGRRPTHSISNNVLAKNIANIRIKKLIEEATILTSYRGNCDAFTCTYAEDEQLNDVNKSKP